MGRSVTMLVTIAGDASGLNTTLDQVSGRLNKFGGDTGSLGSRIDGVSSKLSNAGRSMRDFGSRATAVVSLPIVAAFGYAEQAASNLNEAVNATNVVFGDAADTIDSFASRSATAIGLSQRAFREAVTPMGAMLENLGFSQQEAADQSVALAKRAADMASVFNTDVGTALDAINAGLRGESDPLEQFGVGLSAAAVNAKAMEMGLADSASELTDNQKAQARLALVMDQTNDIAGDFAKTSDETANKQRIMKAEAEDAAAVFGKNLQPVMDRLLGIVGGLLEKFNNLSPGMQQFIMYAGLALAALGPLVSIIGTLVTVVGFLLSPIGLVILAIAALVAIGYVLYRNWDTIQAFAVKVWHTILDAVTGAFHWIQQNWPLILGIITGPIGLAVLMVTRHWQTIKDAFTAVKDWIKNRIDDIVGFFAGLPSRLANAAGDLFGFIIDSFKAAINAVIGLWNGLSFPSVTVGGGDPLGAFGPSLPSVTIGGWDLPNIPYLHQGGTFRAPTGQREGLAMLLNGERVLAPGDSGGAINVYVQGSILSERDLVRVIRDEIQRGGFGGLL